MSHASGANLVRSLRTRAASAMSRRVGSRPSQKSRASSRETTSWPTCWAVGESKSQRTPFDLARPESTSPMFSSDLFRLNERRRGKLILSVRTCGARAPQSTKSFVKHDLGPITSWGTLVGHIALGTVQALQRLIEGEIDHGVAPTRRGVGPQEPFSDTVPSMQ